MASWRSDMGGPVRLSPALAFRPAVSGAGRAGFAGLARRDVATLVHDRDARDRLFEKGASRRHGSVEELLRPAHDEFVETSQSLHHLFPHGRKSRPGFGS